MYKPNDDLTEQNIACDYFNGINSAIYDSIVIYRHS
jgi:hypothetical protein